MRNLAQGIAVDLVVYGGGLAGVDAACAAAAAGRRCLLVERRTYLGWEITATGQYWLAAAAGLPPVPDQLKLALEERLLAAGVELLYGLRPIHVAQRDGLCHVAFVGKGGQRVLVTAREYVDLSRQAGLADPEAVKLGRRTLEFTGVDLARLAEAEVPASVASYCRFERGAAVEHDHVLVTYGVAGDERQVRLAAVAVVRWLKEHHPAFAGARWTASAPDVVGAVPQPQPERIKVDVLVIGGGTSGVPAAIGAARQGADTLLVELNADLGGTGTVGGVDSYWFGRRGGFNAEVAARVAALHQWMGVQGNKWNVEGKKAVWLQLVGEAGVRLLTESVLVDVHRTTDGRLTGATIATPDQLIEVEAAVIIDATGDGDVAVRAGAEWVYGSDREGITMWYSMAQLIRPGVTKNNFTSTVDVGDVADYTRAILSARRRLPGYDHGTYIAPRESRHIIGDVRLTLTDILTMRRWPDVVNLHFSNHDIKGQNTSDWLRMGLIPPNLEVEIPYGMLLPKGVEGLLVTGKAISATHDALPPIRMQADLENLGYVCGVAAGLSARRHVTPRALPVAELQQRLVDEQLLPPSLLGRSLEVAPPTVAELQGWIEALDDSQKLYEYGEMEMDEVRREPIPLVAVCTAGQAIVPLLRDYAGVASAGGSVLPRAPFLRSPSVSSGRPNGSTDPSAPATLGCVDGTEPAAGGTSRRLMVARALAWYGDRAATPVLLEAIAPFLAGEGLPPRTAHIRYTQASPDHGAMPELAYLLHTLALVRDERAIPVLEAVVARLRPTMEQVQDQMSGLFDYVDSVCDMAERLGHPGCLPALRRLHALPLLHDQVTTDRVTPDFFAERLAYLEVVIGRAMARCGDREGARLLADYLGDSRAMLVRHAHRELQAITGQQFPPERTAWQQWLAGITELAPAPWTGELVR